MSDLNKLENGLLKVNKDLKQKQCIEKGCMGKGYMGMGWGRVVLEWGEEGVYGNGVRKGCMGMG